MDAAAARIESFQPIEELEAGLIDSWCGVSQLLHRFLVLLREFDLREGWRSYGVNDCAEWLNWKCGISRVTALEKLRVARALWLLPQTDAAFERGDLSYSKVRALTRVATDINETELLSFALDATATQLEGYCRRLRNGDAQASVGDARRLQASRSLVRQFREDGSGSLSVELPREELELVLEALEFVGGRLPDDPTRSLFAKAADALVQMARQTLAGRGDGAAASDEYQVVVHVDATALSAQGGKADLPVPTVKRLCCDGAVLALVENGEGEPLNVGRKQRSVPTAIKRALLARDRTCTWPGCHHEHFLEAHHIRHWADGGETSLANLTLICGAHHKLLHEGGFTIERHRNGSCYFARPDGRPVDDRHPVAGCRVEEFRPRYRVSFSAEEPAGGWEHVPYGACNAPGAASD